MEGTACTTRAGMGNVLTVFFRRLDGWDRLESVIIKEKEKDNMLVDPDYDNT